MNVSKAAASGQSLNERAFILQALETSGIRSDGRKLHDLRPIRLHFGRSHGKSHAEVQFGRTRVRVVVTSEIVKPFADRPVEGFLSFNVDPTRLQESSGGRQDSESRAVLLTTIVENGIREARAIDTEALCIVAGEKAWSIHCEIHVLDDGGNLIDATCFATIAAIRHFRRPDITVNDGKVIEHSLEERNPIALSVHHTPISLTYGFIRPSTTTASSPSSSATSSSSSSSSQQQQHGNDCAVLVDPTEREEMVLDGTMTIIMNLHGELCGVHKVGSPGLSLPRMMQCIQRAKIKIHKLSVLLKKELVRADALAKEKLIVYANEKRKNINETTMMMSAGLKPGEKSGGTDFGERTNKVLEMLPGLPGSSGHGGSRREGEAEKVDEVEEVEDVQMKHGDDADADADADAAPLFDGGVTRTGKKRQVGGGGSVLGGGSAVSSLHVTLVQNDPEGEGRRSGRSGRSGGSGGSGGSGSKQHTAANAERDMSQVEEFATMVKKIQSNITAAKDIPAVDVSTLSTSLSDAVKGKAKERLDKKRKKKKKKKGGL